MGLVCETPANFVPAAAAATRTAQATTINPALGAGVGAGVKKPNKTTKFYAKKNAFSVELDQKDIKLN